MLEEFHEGIIALSACLAGEVQRYVARGLYEEGKEAALRYEHDFRKGELSLWSSRTTGLPDQQAGQPGLAAHEQEETGSWNWWQRNHVHYTYAEDEKAARHSAGVIQTGKKRGRTRTGCATRAGSIYMQVRGRDAGPVPYMRPRPSDNTQKIARPLSGGH